MDSKQMELLKMKNFLESLSPNDIGRLADGDFQGIFAPEGDYNPVGTIVYESREALNEFTAEESREIEKHLVEFLEANGTINAHGEPDKQIGGDK